MHGSISQCSAFGLAMNLALIDYYISIDVHDTRTKTFLTTNERSRKIPVFQDSQDVVVNCRIRPPMLRNAIEGELIQFRNKLIRTRDGLQKKVDNFDVTYLQEYIYHDHIRVLV